MAGISCQIVRGTEGNILEVNAPNGKESLLYRDALEQYGDPEVALDVWTAAYTDGFKTTLDVSHLEHLNSTKKGFKMIKNDGSQIHYKRSGKTVSLDLLLTSPELRGKGYANAIMNDFTKWADENGYTIKAVVSPRDRFTSEDTIKGINLSHGFQFESVNGFKSDFEMIRYPKRINRVYDSNGEPALKYVIKYLKDNTEVEDLTDEDKMTLSNMMIRFSENNSENFSQRLDLLFPDGIFSISALNSSDLFSDYDKRNITRNKEYRDNLFVLNEQLKNMNNPFEVPTADNKDFHVLSGEVNKYGVSVLINPYEVQSNISNLVSGVKNRIDFDEQFNKIDYEGIKERYNTDKEFADRMFKLFSPMDKLPVKHINEEGNLENDYKPNRSTATENAMNLSNVNFTTDINVLEQLTQEMWDEHSDDVVRGLKEIEKKGISASMDLSGLSDFSGDRESTLSFLRTLRDLENDPNEDNFAAFLDEYDRIFEVNNEPKYKTAQEYKQPSQHINEPLSEYEMYDKYKLIKLDKNRYIKVDDLSTDLLEQQLGEDQTEFIKNNINKISVSEGEYDYDTVVKILLNKKINDIPIENKQTPPSDSLLKSINKFDGDVEYLTTDYLTDFYNKYLKERNRNSDKYKEVYSKFSIGNRGITLENSDPVTVYTLNSRINELLSDKEINDLRNYSVLSKDGGMKSLFEIPEDNPIMTVKSDRRNYYMNNIDSLPVFEGTYSRISEGGIVTNTPDGEFIKIDNALYESTQSMGGQTFYKKIPTYRESVSIFDKTQKFNKFSNSAVKEYLRIELTRKSNNNLYSRSELEEINENNFDCVA